MKNSDFIKRGFLFAAGLFFYVMLVATIMSHAATVFGDKKTLLGPVVFLMLFVFSATISGGLVFGYPAWLFLNGKKKESLKQLFYTILFIFIILIMSFTVGFLVR